MSLPNDSPGYREPGLSLYPNMIDKICQLVYDMVSVGGRYEKRQDVSLAQNDRSPKE